MRAFLSLALSASLAAHTQQPVPQTSPPNQDSEASSPSNSAPTPAGAVTIPAGSKIQLYLSNPLNSRTAQVGDVVHAEVAFPVVVNQRLLIPRGAFADGAVTKITRPGFSHHANIAIQFTRIIFENGYSVSLAGATAQASNEFPAGSPLPAPDGTPSARDAVVAGAPTAQATSTPFAMLLFQTPPPLLPPPGPPKGFIIGAAVAGAITIFLIVYGISHHGGEIYLHSGWQIDMILQAPVVIDADRATAPRHPLKPAVTNSQAGQAGAQHAARANLPIPARLRHALRFAPAAVYTLRRTRSTMEASAMRRQTWQCLVTLLLCFAIAARAAQSAPAGNLVVANQGDHTLLLLDLATQKQIASVEVGVNGHEVAVSPDEKFAFVPIYGNSGVGKPGSDGRTIDVVDLRTHALAGHIDLGKPVRPHCAKFGPDGRLYVSAELANAIFVVDIETRQVLAQIPTGAAQSHMFVISPNGRRIYTANVSSGSVSVLDLEKRSVITIIPVAKTIQRIAISPDGRYVFTHDQDAPRIAVIDTATNKIAKWIEVPSTIYSSAVTPEGQRLVALSPSGSVFVIDLAQSKVVSTIPVPQASGEIILSPDGAHAFASCPGAASIQIIDLRSGKLEPPFALTKGVDGLGWTHRL